MKILSLTIFGLFLYGIFFTFTADAAKEKVARTPLRKEAILPKRFSPFSAKGPDKRRHRARQTHEQKGTKVKTEPAKDITQELPMFNNAKEAQQYTNMLNQAREEGI